MTTTTRQHMLTLEDVLDRAKPLGRNRAREVILLDPRFPAPILSSDNRKLYSASAIDDYFQRVEAEGFPHRAVQGEL